MPQLFPLSTKENDLIDWRKWNQNKATPKYWLHPRRTRDTLQVAVSVFTHRSRENERKTQRLYIHRHSVLLQIAGPWLCPSHYLLLFLSAPDIKLHIGHVFFLQSHQHLSEGGSVVWMQLTSNLSLWEKPSHHHESSGHQSPDFNHPQDSRSQDLPAPIVFILRITFSLLSSYDYIFKCLFVF